MSIESRLEKLEEDAYFGDGADNPPFTTRLKLLEADMTTVQEGVSNFRSFQLQAQKRLGFLNGAVWVAGAVWAVMLLLLAWALTLIIPAAKAVMDDYYHNHPAAKISQVEPEQAKYELAK